MAQLGRIRFSFWERGAFPPIMAASRLSPSARAVPRGARLERQRLLPGRRRDGRRRRCVLIHGGASTESLSRRRARAGSATLDFDWQCVRDAGGGPGVCLVLGYNGAMFLPYLRPVRPQDPHQHGRHRVEAAEMGCPFAPGSMLTNGSRPGPRTGSSPTIRRSPTICDAPAPPAITVIPYGGDPIVAAPVGAARALGLEPGRYMISIARIEPDNNIADDGRGLLRAAARLKLVVLGKLDDGNAYHARCARRPGARLCSPARSTIPHRARAAVPRPRLSARAHGRRHQSVAGRGAVGRQRRHRARQRLQPLDRRRGRALFRGRGVRGGDRPRARRRRSWLRGARRGARQRADGVLLERRADAYESECLALRSASAAPRARAALPAAPRWV